MRWSKEIWEELQQKSTIKNCFQHTGVVFNGVKESKRTSSTYSADVSVDDIIIRAAELRL
jgi:hypothetical protein